AGFDYDSLNGHIYQSVKWPGVIDTFRVPKPGAGFYQSQVDPKVRPVIAPGFFWDFGPNSPATGPGPNTVIATNCDRLELYVAGQHLSTALPDHARFPNLQHPPAFVDLTVSGTALPELRIDGYVGNHLVTTKTFASDPRGDRLSLVADDHIIDADGSDATRVVFRAVDAHGNQRPYVTGSVGLAVTGPAVLIGDNPFAFADFGGVGAVWLRSIPNRRGAIRLTATHPTLGTASVLVLAT
ncbi:MAG TPA: beta-galactosidase, partial [Pseudonocardiaceae bacterium]